MRCVRPLMPGRAAALALLLGLALGGCDAIGQSTPDAGRETAQPASDPARLRYPDDYLRVTGFPGGLAVASLPTWREHVPEVQRIELPASADDSRQPALFYDSGSARDKPLLLVLHSWSTDYRQTIDIPLARFAIDNDWVFMHPDFRGANDGRPESTASSLVISDMEDALAYAREHARVDPSRIYLLGYSGGAMNALHLASRHPDTFAGIAAWVPVYDLTSWYRWNAERGEKYAGEIEQACGGVPNEGTPAHAECLQRSPRARLDEVRGELTILIAHGIDDTTVPPDQALRAFNDLAREADRIPEAQVRQLRETREVPAALVQRSVHRQRDYPHFAEAEAEVLLHLQSGPAELILFDGGHDMLYRPGLAWLARQRR